MSDLNDTIRSRPEAAAASRPLPEAVDIVLVNAAGEDALRIARALVEDRLAACVNVVPGVTSIYRWEGAVHEDAESTMIIKTRRALVGELTARIRELHPYAVPEVIAIPIALDRGNAAYLAWVVTETRAPVLPAK